MTTIHLTSHLDVPIERVFELVTDFRRYPEWNVNYREVRDIAGPTDQPGTRVYGVLTFLGRPIQGWGEIVEVDAPLMIRLAGGGEGGMLNLTYRLTPLETGTDLACDIEYELPAGIFGEIADHLFVERAMERDLRHSTENFQALLTSRTPVLA